VHAHEVGGRVCVLGGGGGVDGVGEHGAREGQPVRRKEHHLHVQHGRAIRCAAPCRGRKQRVREVQRRLTHRLGGFAKQELVVATEKLRARIQRQALHFRVDEHERVKRIVLHNANRTSCRIEPTVLLKSTLEHVIECSGAIARIGARALHTPSKGSAN